MKVVCDPRGFLHRPTIPSKRLILAVTVGLLAGSCGQKEDAGTAPRRPPNLLLIVVDTLRASALGNPVQTPHLNRLAAESSVFQNAVSHIPATGPSHSTLFTGRHPLSHGVHLNAQELPAEATTLAELLQDAGYSTSAVVSLGVLRRAYGFAQGFVAYNDHFPQQWFRLGKEISDHAISWLRENTARPFFLFVHYSDPHMPYGRPDRAYPRFRVLLDGQPVGEGRVDGLRRVASLELAPGAHELKFVPLDPSTRRMYFRGLKDRPPVTLRFGSEWNRPPAAGEVLYTASLPAKLEIVNGSESVTTLDLPLFIREILTLEEARLRYSDEVSYVDQQVGRLLQELERQGLKDQTLIVFTSDHGEALGEHDHRGHIEQLYQTMLHVPLMFRWPAVVPSNEKRTDLARHIDVLPSILSVLGLATPPGLPGRNLFGAGAEGTPRIPFVAATFRPLAKRDLRSLTFEGFKLIRHEEAKETELYALAEDPEELHDVSGRETELTRRYLSILNRYLEQAEDSASTAEVPLLSEGEKEQLEALGYVQ